MINYFRSYFATYKGVRDMTKSEISKITLCKPPCTYYKYRFAGKADIISKDKFGLRILLANTEMIEEDEHLLYDFISLVSEFGGSLGLFLGFSFFMIWDFIAPMILVLKKSIRSK